MSLKKALFSISVCLLGATAFALDLVKDGHPQAEIVVSAKAPQGVKLAAKDLQHFIRQISGAKLDIVNVPTNKFKNRLFVGENEFTAKLGYKLPKFNNSGFDLYVKDNYAVFSGPNTVYPRAKFTHANWKEFRNYMDGKVFSLEFFQPGSGTYNRQLNMDVCDDIGAWYAVVEALERFGVRFYAPYKNGTIIPERKNLSLKSGRTTKEAAFGRRQYTYYGAMREDAEGVLWLKRTGCGVRNGVVMNHTTRALLGPQVNRKTNPSWYAEETPGKSFISNSGQGGVPRYTDPDFQKTCIFWANKLLDTYPTLSAVTLGSPDGGNMWDWRDQKKYCKPGMSLQQAYADMMWDFHMIVAEGIRKKHPDKNLIWWCQYNNSIPTNAKPGKYNIIFPGLTLNPTHLVVRSVFRNAIDFQKKMYEKVKPANKAPNWEWWLSYNQTDPRYPIFFPRVLQEWRKAQLPYSDGVFTELSPASHCGVKGAAGRRIGAVAISHLMLYLNNKLLWEPDLDVQKLLDEYYTLWFGPAAAEMKQFHEFAESVWCRDASRSVTENSGFLKEQDVSKYFELLAAAKAKTNAGSIYHQRIDAMEKGYAPLKKLFPSLKRTGPTRRAYFVPNNTVVDGNLSKYKHGWMTMLDNRSGEEVRRNATHAVVSLSQNRKMMYVGIRCYESAMDKIVKKCTANDDKAIFEDDLVEIYLDTPEKSYFKIAVNPNGAIWDETTDVTIINRDSMGFFWNPGIKAVVKTYPDRWEVELMIPTADFGKMGPTMQYPWGLNICRTRISSLGFSRQKAYSIAPTGSNPYRAQKFWAKMWMRF